MTTQVQITIIVKNTSNVYSQNKDLMDYILKNKEKLNKYGYYIKMHRYEPGSHTYNAEKFPALICEDKMQKFNSKSYDFVSDTQIRYVYGHKYIKNYLQTLMNNKGRSQICQIATSDTKEQGEISQKFVKKLDGKLKCHKEYIPLYHQSAINDRSAELEEANKTLRTKKGLVMSYPTDRRKSLNLKDITETHIIDDLIHHKNDISENAVGIPVMHENSDILKRYYDNQKFTLEEEEDTSFDLIRESTNKNQLFLNKN